MPAGEVLRPVHDRAHRAGLKRLVRRLLRAPASTRSAIERRDGPVVDALLAAGLTVLVISPNQVKNLRSRYGSAGNKDDRFDAYVLADVLRTDRRRLRPLTRTARRPSRCARTVPRPPGPGRATGSLLANQLRAHLQIVFPGAVGLFAELDSAISLRVPDPVHHPGPGRLALPEPAGRLAGAASATAAAPTPPSCTPGCTAAPRGTTGADAAAACRDHPRLRRRPAHPEHPDQRPRRPDRRPTRRPPRRAHLHQPAPLRDASAPPGCSPRSATAAARFPTPESLACLAGVAPSTRQSGKIQRRHLPLGRRQAAPRRRHRLRRRLPPRQPLGRRPLRPRPRPRPRPPPRRPHPRPRLAVRHLALLAGPHRLRPRAPPRPAAPARRPAQHRRPGRLSPDEHPSAPPPASRQP